VRIAAAVSSGSCIGWLAQRSCSAGAGMRSAVAVVSGWRVVEVVGDLTPMDSASLVKLVIGHLALEVIDDLDEAFYGPITFRHVLSHTSGLPNSRSPGGELITLRPPGVRWGYSGGAFALLQRELERRTGRDVNDLAAERVFVPLGMNDSAFERASSGFRGYRPLLTSAADFGRFLAQVLSINDERWEPQCRIDDELAWGAGWGLELGDRLYGWQWGLTADVSHFVIGCPATGHGVVVLTDDPEHGRDHYRRIVQETLPGDHASLRVEHNPIFVELAANP
jgi:CubicO group peptidase (beta-lactamase class C family)